MSDADPDFYLYDEDDVVVEDGDLVIISEDEEDDEDEDEDDEDDDYDYVVDPGLLISNVASVKNKTTALSVDDNSCGIEDLMSKDNSNEIDGLFCPICMEPWTSQGVHQVCCLPCGHIYGLSCIQKWIRQRQSSRKCPQCKRSCNLKDVRLLYASRIVVVDDELQKKVQKLEAKCASLETKHTEHVKREDEGKRREAELHLQVQQLKQRARYLEGVLECSERGAESVASNDFLGNSFTGQFRKTACSNSFALQKEFHIEGARIFDMDASGQILLIARRLTGLGGQFALTKIGLVAPHDRLDIQLPVSTKAVKDLRFSPHDRLLLVASLGKKLSIISSESNNTILSYDLPAAAWSCSWDNSCSHYAYAGLQNGMLLMFDLRQTREPVKSLAGLTCNPIHSLYSVSPKSASSSSVRTVLTASSVGVCEWNFGGVDERPFLVPGSENEGVCVSLACSFSNSNIVASYRPKVEMLNKELASQAVPTPSVNPMGNSVPGSHVSYKRTSSQCYQKLGATCANVNDIRLPKSAIVDVCNDDTPLFVSGDEVRGEVTLQSLPSLVTVQHLNPRKFPVRDVKFTHGRNSSILGCLCDDMLQLYSPKLL